MAQTESARYTYRLRMSHTSRRALLDEWDRCRWVWNQCVAESKQTYQGNRDRAGPDRTGKPANPLGWTRC